VTATNGHPTPTIGRPQPPEWGARVGFGQDVYNRVMDFLIEEARVLDENELEDWTEMLADDLRYTMPVRRTVLRGDETVDPQMLHFDDDLASVKMRVWRITRSEYGYSENPQSRVRRYITNVSVHETATPGEYAVRSYQLVLRSRWDMPDYDYISSHRDDVLRVDESAPFGFKLSARIIITDQVMIGTPNIAIML
jgi:3-phenylpropionate/cinnamic acid dioxygenase small subunit